MTTSASPQFAVWDDSRACLLAAGKGPLQGAGIDELLEGAGDVLDRHLGVDPVLVEQFAAVCVQPPQRVLQRWAGCFRPAIEAACLAGGQLEAEFGGEHDVVADRLQRLADQFLVVEGPVDLCGVEAGLGP